MRSITRNCVTSAMLAVALSLPVAAWAETGGTPAGAPAGAPTAAGEMAGAKVTAATPRERVEQRIADMHASLHITSTQDPQWDQFAQVMLDNGQAMQVMLSKHAGDAQMQSADAIMQDYAQVAELHAQNVRKLSAAFNTLYASLAPDQKTAADEMFRSTAAEHAQKTGG